MKQKFVLEKTMSLLAAMCQQNNKTWKCFSQRYVYKNYINTNKDKDKNVDENVILENSTGNCNCIFMQTIAAFKLNIKWGVKYFKKTMIGFTTKL